MEAPRQFGSYDLVRSIAVGGMGEIYLARAAGIAGFEKYLALKVIRPQYANDKGFVSMLVEEAKLAVRLNHVNICQIFDLGVEEGRYYIAMEFVDGLDLYRLIKQTSEAGERIPFDMAAFIAAEICAGVDYAHSRKDVNGEPLGVIHRDLSPHNVLVGYDGSVKIIDFGIAKAMARAKTTAAGVIKGKLTYLSPEQASAGEVDHRADLFCVGAVLYELITCTKLYRKSDNLQDTLRHAKHALYANPRRWRRDLPKSLEDIILKALSREPDDRYQSGEEMRDVLLRWLHTSGTSFNRRQLEAYLGGKRQEPSTMLSAFMKSDFQIEADKSVIFKPGSDLYKAVVEGAAMRWDEEEDEEEGNDTIPDGLPSGVNPLPITSPLQPPEPTGGAPSETPTVAMSSATVAALDVPGAAGD